MNVSTMVDMGVIALHMVAECDGSTGSWVMFLCACCTAVTALTMLGGTLKSEKRPLEDVCEAQVGGQGFACFCLKHQDVQSLLQLIIYTAGTSYE